jgi:uncharacterized cupin superfamily protein
MRRRIVNLADLEFREHAHGTRFAAAIGAIAPRLGARKLGYRLTVLAPGTRAWPFHSHHANEEMFLILEGSGRLRYGAEEHAVRAGDVICAPAGGAGTAHQIVNDSDRILKYLCVSTMLEPDVIEYPDSGKFAAFAGAAPGGDRHARTFETCARHEDAVDYWDGEKQD